MTLKIIAGLVALILLLVYLGPVVFKLWDPALNIVILIGFAMMLIDLWQSLQSKND
ncbi:MAG: hypothetical protein OEM83_02170 [Gammaproteobacteria bacterium]|nr:hypothetical protein [Gammaproteobacteria bacterium]